MLTPALDTEYVSTRDRGISAEADEMLMIVPPCPRSTIALPNTWQQSRYDVRLVSRMRCHSSRPISKNGVLLLAPAALSRMSTGPRAASAAARAASTEV